jgi:single-stranded-DNA-specific exonuclease
MSYKENKIEIKNLKKAAKKIKEAITKKKNIVLYGDSDLDGVCSVIIIQDVIKNLGGNISCVYFPNRETEGYGLNESALNYLERFSPGLLILFDCGTGNNKEIKMAVEKGFDVIVIDHHEILDKIPEKSIVVNPKQKGDKYPFKFFCTTGLSLKLSFEILGEKMSDLLRGNFLELAALATIADMMPEKEDNQVIIEEGLSYLEKTYRPGLAVFFEMPEITRDQGIKAFAQDIVSVLNIVEPKDHLNSTYILLSISSLDEAKLIAKDLIIKREQKKSEIKRIMAEVQESILRSPKDAIIFQASSTWPIPLLGSTASRICSLYNKPTFLISKKDKISRGTVRSPEGINSVKLLQKCSSCLLSFGGHPQAAGFTIDSQKIEEFKNCLIKQFI